MLIHFRPTEARTAARWLSTVARPRRPVVVSCDPDAGHVELANVCGSDLGALTNQLYRRGARSVFVRYAHEGRPLVGDRPVTAASARGEPLN
jgi:hypothetical protein